jgi:hypothetical protein
MQNGDRVILRAYFALRLEFLAYKCSDLARLFMNGFGARRVARFDRFL